MNSNDMTTKQKSGVISRRLLLQGAGASALAAPFINLLVTPARAQGSGVLNIASYGGSYGDSLKAAWLDPFEKETGIKVNLGVNASLAMAKLQTMNPAGAEWDIVDLTTAEYNIAVRENMLSPLEGNNVDTTQLLPEYVQSHGFGYATFVWVLGWNNKLIPASDAPTSWTEFWDMKRYRSKRTLQTVKTNGHSIEAALLADGVPMDKMYPVDVDRAFASLDKLGKDNIIWAMTNQEPVQRISTGETPLGGIFTGRAIMANRAGADIGFSLNQANIGGDVMSVIKTAKNKKEAFALLNYIATKGDRAADFTARTSYAVPHKDVERLLPKDAADIRATLPTNPELQKSAFFSDETWWANNLPDVANRFQEWQLS